jgi:hypothetical protein
MDAGLKAHGFALAGLCHGCEQALLDRQIRDAFQQIPIQLFVPAPGMLEVRWF